jgi:DNA modification methylase
VALDPFAGSGTVGRVALKHRRRAVLIDLNPDYIDLAEQRTDGVQVALPLIEEALP